MLLQSVWQLVLTPPPPPNTILVVVCRRDAWPSFAGKMGTPTMSIEGGGGRKFKAKLNVQHLSREFCQGL